MIHLDAGAVAFAIAVSMACAVAVSLVPAWHATRRDLSARYIATPTPRRARR